MARNYKAEVQSLQEENSKLIKIIEKKTGTIQKWEVFCKSKDDEIIRLRTAFSNLTSAVRIFQEALKNME